MVAPNWVGSGWWGVGGGWYRGGSGSGTVVGDEVAVFGLRVSNYHDIFILPPLAGGEVVGGECREWWVVSWYRNSGGRG